jgi:predicted regulator of Ras-like GTPase activity (Roadblock/LC7/MglB family)
MSRLLEMPGMPQDRKGSGVNRLNELNRILRKLQMDSPGIETSALISEDGLMIARAENMNIEETRVAGMAATLLNLGTRASMELARGSVQEVIVRGENGYVVVLSAGRGTLLLAVTNEAAKLGLIFFDMREAIRALQKVL